jgi:hypothetical protein
MRRSVAQRLRDCVVCLRAHAIGDLSGRASELIHRAARALRDFIGRLTSGFRDVCAEVARAFDGSLCVHFGCHGILVVKRFERANRLHARARVWRYRTGRGCRPWSTRAPEAGALLLDYLPLSFDAGFIASLLVEAVDDELGDEELADVELGDVELEEELGAMELGVDELDEAVELGVDEEVSVVVDDELLVAGGVAGIDGVVELDELLVEGGVAGASTFCWQPATATRTAAAAAVIMNRFIMAPFLQMILSFGQQRSVVSRFGANVHAWTRTRRNVPRHHACK